MSTTDDGAFRFYFRGGRIPDVVRGDIDPVGALHEAARRASESDQARLLEDLPLRRFPRLPPARRRQP
jgi:hypothetical protein